MAKKQGMSSVNHISSSAVVTRDSVWLPIFHIIHLQASEKTFAYPLNEICPGKVEAVSGQKDKINKVQHNITLSGLPQRTSATLPAQTSQPQFLFWM